MNGDEIKSKIKEYERALGQLDDTYYQPIRDLENEIIDAERTLYNSINDFEFAEDETLDEELLKIEVLKKKLDSFKSEANSKLFEQVKEGLQREIEELKKQLK